MEDEDFDMALFPKQYDPNFLNEVSAQSKIIHEKIMKENWFSLCKKILMIVTAGIAVIGLFYTCKYFFGVKKKEDENIKDISADVGETSKLMEGHPALAVSGDVKTKFFQKIRTNVKSANKLTVHNVRPAGANEFETLLETYRMSIVEMSTPDRKYLARCICISPGVYLTQLHSFCTIISVVGKQILSTMEQCNNPSCGRVHEEGCMYTIEKVNQAYPIVFRRLTKNGSTDVMNVTLSKLYEMNSHTFGVDSEGSDMVTFKLKSQHFVTANIKKYLISEKKYEVHVKDVVFYEPGTLDGKKKISRYSAANTETIQVEVRYKGDDIRLWAPGESEVIMRLYGYRISNPITNGFHDACGSVLIDKVSCKIVGIMSAAASEWLYFNNLSEEQVEEAFGWHDNWVTNSEGKRVDLVPKESNFVPIDGELSTLVTKTTPALRIYHSTKTSIKESVCYEKFGPIKRAPCHISQCGDKGELAMAKGLSNYKPHLPFPKEDIDQAFLDIRQMFRNECVSNLDVCSKRTMNEAICGIAGFIPSLTMSTSPGFPWVCKSGMSRKKDLIEIEDGRVIGIHKNLKAIIDDEEQRMERGEAPTTIYQLSHKDERLPLNKLDNVRLIQGSPLSLTLSARRYLMDFNYAFQYSRANLEHCVGINVESLEWDSLARALVDFSPYICVGDYSKFGPRLLSEFVTKSYEIMNDWYAQYECPPEHQTIRTMLGKRAIDSLNMCYDVVVKLKCGSPSGSINTVIVNSLCNMFYIRCAWIGVMKRSRPELAGVHHFKSFVKFFCYGDDVIFAVKPELIEVFNNETISQYLSEYDVKYTDVTKDGAMRKYCTIEEASFLKRKFVFFTDTPMSPGVWIAQSDYGEVVDTTNWVRLPKGVPAGAEREKMLIEAAVVNCEDAVRRLWFHGRSAFESFQDKVQRYFREIKAPRKPTYYTFHGLQTDYGITVWQHPLDSYLSILDWGANHVLSKPGIASAHRKSSLDNQGEQAHSENAQASNG